ncbi:nuclear transport factor 2 family protein [Phenylobacterium sp. NIBR 498073]|uniref:nuclear transport factor 2 family protein n=1 Tax=Phenylobacterium sp. NIBR 498073 TaxID=3015177 RepID=UPI0022B3044A|nr:nuclear transport factor 2 family protein [Phenylobacterium sp. NIBR 498073]WGU41121.1 nuclear transport factor 2 family protein [Phenylobacterium sp. NIBR 498073]
MSSITPKTLKTALEGRDASALIGFYVDDAVIQIIDRDHPPSAPLELRGKAQIARYYEDVCGRAMTHRLESAVADDAHMAFSESCAYPDGTRVFCTAMLDLDHGQIRNQVTVQAWDA